jgi:hypothetical protein
MRTVLLVLLVGALGAGCDAEATPAHGGPLVRQVSSAAPTESGRRESTSSPTTSPAEALVADLAAGRCPQPAPSAGDVKVSIGSSLPSIGAVKLVLCRYQGGHDARPPATTIADPAIAESWRQRFNRLRVADSDRYPCPYDNGSAVLVGFLRDNHVGTVVRVSLSGCRFVTAGTVTRWTDATFRDALLRLIA